MAKTKHQSLSSQWEVALTVRKFGGTAFKSKIFKVFALNRLDADIAARQAARKAGYEVGIVQEHVEVIQKAFHKKVVFGESASRSGRGTMPIRHQ